MKKAKKTSAESAHLLAVKQLPCCTCDDGGPSEAHHVRDQGSRIGDFITIPLCVACHRGPSGVHGDKSMLRITNTTELQWADATIQEIYRARS